MARLSSAKAPTAVRIRSGAQTKPQWLNAIGVLFKLMRLHHLINEIQKVSGSTPRKAAFDIYNVLENNKKLFADSIDQDTFAQILKTFEKMAYSSAAEFNSSSYKDEFNKTYSLLDFYLSKVI